MLMQESLRLYLQEVCPYVDINHGLDLAFGPPLPWALRDHYWEPGKIKLLLNYGSHVGSRCLHSALRGSMAASHDDIQEVLRMLIAAGADVYEKDRKGLTPSHIVCSRRHGFIVRTFPRSDRSESRNNDLVLKKLWTQALMDCGYDAERVISASIGASEPHGSCRCGSCRCGSCRCRSYICLRRSTEDELRSGF